MNRPVTDRIHDAFFRPSGVRRALAATAMVVLTLAAGPASAQTLPDGDGDGVPDNVDLCPGSAAGRRVVLHGCDPLEGMTFLPMILDYAYEGVGEALGIVRATPDLADRADRLERLDRSYLKVIDMLASGRVCKAAALSERFGRKLEKTRTSLGRLVESRTRRLASVTRVIADEEAADADDTDRRITDMAVARDLYGRALASLAEEMARIVPFCSARTGELRSSGRIVSIDDGAHLLELDNGLRVVVGNRAVRGTIWEGAQVEVRGDAWEGSTGLASVIIPDAVVKNPGTLAVQCMFLRVLPAQPFPPVGAGPYVMHNPEAYRARDFADNSLVLETDMALAVIDNGGCGDLGPAPDGSFSRISASIDILRYAQSDVVLAADLTEDDDPVRLSGVPYGDGLRLTVRKQTCRPVAPGAAPDCDPPVEVRSEEHRIRLWGPERCTTLVYDDDAYDVDDSDPDSFAVARLVDWDAFAKDVQEPDEYFGGGVSDVVPAAEGYTVTGGVPSYPTVHDIGPDDEFAIFNLERDFYPVDDIFPFLTFAATGVKKPSGVKWPKVTGTRNGSPFSYACGLPSIGRDRLAECSEDPDTYYRFPFEGGAPEWSLGQANNGTFTHFGFGAFAFDFGAPAGTPVLAARSGIVVTVEESNTGNCFCAPPACSPARCTDCAAPNGNNFVVVQHFDGTVGRYFHFPADGASVEEGQRVYRGDQLGVVGNTGCSSNAHLHFEVGAAPGEATIPIKFESEVPGEEICYLPETGDPVESTNTPNP
jgi:murein DD-endopeptidase MepM/ murein hydrolase activator NlpD